MPNSRFYSSVAAVTSLQVSIAPVDTSIQLASSVGFPGSFPFTLALDYGSANEELVDVVSGGPSIYSITRAVDGTSASTHNAGAVVRHVSSARDFTDSRTHEASASGVHGISGAFVDTTSAQGVANKTFTSSTFSGGTISGTIAGSPTFTGAVALSGGGSLAGTFSGSPTFSGNPTFSGTPVLSTGAALSGTFSGNPTFSGTVTATGLIQSSRATAGQQSLAALVTGDLFDRYRLYPDGKQEIGPGNAARDTTLERTGVGALRLTGSFTATGDVGATNVTATSNVTATGALNGATAAITGAASVGGNLTHTGTGIRYHPAVTGTASVAFATASSNVLAVAFGTTFSSAPNVHTNINSGAGNTSQWGSRAINITTTGFDLFVFGPSNQIWLGVPVGWTAIAQ